jgi:hypothetical protein
MSLKSGDGGLIRSCGIVESAFRSLVNFGVLNNNLIKGLILYVKCITGFK